MAIDGLELLQIDVRGRRFPLALKLPTDGSPARPPVLLFLHGSGERGDDGERQVSVGIGPHLEHPRYAGCVVAMPQCPTGGTWVDGTGEALVAATLRLLLDGKYRVDPRRVYLTGISMGGHGAWRTGAVHVDRLAALVPVCGAGHESDAERIARARLPIWAFHGAEDQAVPPEGSRRMVAAMRRASPPSRETEPYDIHYTEFYCLGHVCWDRVYGDDEVIGWLLSQRRSS